ncbi:MAG TPA: phosphodiester glycosidase family protein [Armatimonadota bacterium]|nr:phosphodiester glycosidase family protein [Armatimonadota bacterium]HPT99642.1 phosphodiester glycosidase family protein [Armatimonadota bacterium]
MRRLLRASGITAAVLLLSCSLAAAAGLSVERKKVNAAGKSFAVTVIRVPREGYRVKVGLANGRVGSTASLASIAQSHGAVAAINGCFFSAYTKDAIKPPWHHVITEGQLVHHGQTGTTLGFDAQGNYRMERLKIRITGTVGADQERPHNWYAYRVNFPPGASGAILFNRFWAGAKTPAGGKQAVIQNGVVRSVGSGGLPIPRDGYALSFIGGDAHLGNRFQPGDQVTLRIEYGSHDEEFWQSVQEGLGCGPRLLAEGRIAYDPKGEGFNDPKILSLAGARSAIGIRHDGTILLVTCSATVRQLADIMKALGAYDAMNLDGGASSGLWVQGKYLVQPGRSISNALLILKK